MSGPPPWTTIGFRPDVLEQHDVAGEVLAQRRVAHRRAAVLDDDRPAVELPDVRERLQQRGDVARRRGHVVYSALIVTYSCERSEKNTSASAPSPGSPTVYSTSSPATAAASARLVVGHAPRRPRRPATSSIQMSTRQRGRVVHRLADRLRDPAPVGVAAVQRGLDQRRVGDRPRRRDHVRLVAAVDDHAADAPRRPRRRARSASPGAAAGSRAPRRSAPRPRTPARSARRSRREAIRIAVSLVESCPSTEMRSKERLTQTPSSRSAVSGASAASVWTKQSIVANAGEIIPAPLACAVRRTVPDGQRDLERGRLGELVGGADRLAERVVAVGREVGARGERCP